MAAAVWMGAFASPDWRERAWPTDEVEHGVHLLILHTDHDRRVATPQETAGAGEPGRAVFRFQESIHNVIGVLILHDGDNQFHAWSLLDTGVRRGVSRPTVPFTIATGARKVNQKLPIA